jgi:uncharacterized membrane protein YkvA (DUF1232 family)
VKRFFTPLLVFSLGIFVLSNDVPEVALAALSARRFVAGRALKVRPLAKAAAICNGRAVVERMKAWAASLKHDVAALVIAVRDPRTPVLARVVAALVVAYALSPIDLIPDFVPVLGYLDDLIIVPLGLALVLRLIPAPLMAEYRASALQQPVSRLGWVGLAIIMLLWIGLALWLWTQW